jgi:diguanylate cyclase (GGDEF)-like protein
MLRAMGLGQVAVFESKRAERTRIAAALRRAGLKVTSAEGVDGLAREGLVVIGPGVASPGNVARAVRRAAPEVVVLAASRAAKKASWSDGILPLPISPPDLRVRLPELYRLRDLERAASEAKPSILDPLTGFYTFAHFKELLFVEVKRARRYNFPLSLALVSLDPLPRRIDGALRARLFSSLALAIRQSLRDTDFPVQYNGDHIALVMPHTDLQGALVTSERICERVRTSRLEHGSGPLRPTVSIGVAGSTHPSRQFSFAELVKEAQDAMGRAAAAGGNRVEFGTPELPEAMTAGS